MNKSILTLALITISITSSFSQTPNAAFMSEATRQSLIFQMHVLTEQKKMSFESAVGKLDNSSIGNKQTMSQNKKAVKNYLSNLRNFGNSYNYFVVDDENRVPVGFYTINGKTAFVQSSIFSKNIYSSRLMTPSKRLNTVVRDLILPGLDNFESMLKIPTIEYFCVIAGFLSGDFDESSTKDENGETIVAVIPKLLIKKFLDASITDEQLIKGSTFYAANSTTFARMKKVTIN